MLKVTKVTEVPQEDIVVIEVEMSNDLADIVMQEGLSKVLYDMMLSKTQQEDSK